MVGKGDKQTSIKEDSEHIRQQTNIKESEAELETSPKISGVATPPDGGWGWIIVLSSFSISLLVDGTCFSFGIFFDEFRAVFGTNKSETSWIGSVLNGSYLIFGPVISALVNVYGSKSVAAVGAALSFTAFFISTFSRSIGVFIFVYGFIGGIGFGLMYLPAMVMVGYYFERRRALATGIACCGSGIGAFLFAPFTEHLLHEYGWRGATWIISALVFNAAFFAMFYRPLPKPSVVQKNKPIYKGSPNLNKNKHPLASHEHNNHDEVVGQANKGQFLQSLNSEPSLKPEQRTRSMTLYPPPDDSFHNNNNNGSEVKLAKNNVARLAFSQDFHVHRKSRLDAGHVELDKPLSRKDIFYSGSLWHLKEFQEAGTLDNYRKEVNHNGVAPASTAQPTGIKKFVQAVSSSFDLSLLTSPTFLIYGTSCFLCMAGFFVPFIYLPTHAVDLGLDTSQGAFLISIIGITNTVGRVAVGFVSDQPWADSLLINNVALVIGGVATLFVPFYPYFSLLAVYAGVFGTAIAVFVSLRTIIMVELLGLEKLTTAFGFVIMCQGISSFVGAPIAGAISDANGNYNASFYMAGITLTLSGLICFPLRSVSRWEKGWRSRGHKAGLQKDGSTSTPWSQEMEVKKALLTVEEISPAV